MSTPLYSLVYLSTALKPFSHEDLLELLGKCRAKNSLRGISGMLLYKNRHFMQALEGAEEEVRSLVEVIRHDPRHVGMVTLIEEPIENRRFEGWTMGFENLDTAGENAPPGYQEFRETELTPSDLGTDGSRARKLLSLFWRRM